MAANATPVLSPTLVTDSVAGLRVWYHGICCGTTEGVLGSIAYGRRHAVLSGDLILIRRDSTPRTPLDRNGVGFIDSPLESSCHRNTDGYGYDPWVWHTYALAMHDDKRLDSQSSRHYCKNDDDEQH